MTILTKLNDKKPDKLILPLVANEQLPSAPVSFINIFNSFKKHFFVVINIFLFFFFKKNVISITHKLNYI